MKKMITKMKSKFGKMGLRLRIAILVFLIFMSVGVLVGIFVFSTRITRGLEDKAEMLNRSAKLISEIVDVEKFKFYSENLEPDERYYNTLNGYIRAMGNLKDSIENLYVMSIDEDGEHLTIVYGICNYTDYFEDLGHKFKIDEADREVILPDVMNGRSSEGVNFITHNDDLNIEAWAPIIDAETGETIGLVELNIDLEPFIISEYSEIGHPVISCLVFSIIFSFVLNHIMVVIVSKPLSKLTDYVKSYEHGNFGLEPVTIPNKGEITYLSEAFSGMVERMNEYVEFSKTTEHMNTELEIAAKIQDAMLVKDFDIFSKRHEFDLYASMKPASYVGGDFYDFFYLDDDHLVVTIADVSGGNVSGAMFMMRSMTCIRNWARTGNTPGKVLAYVNDELCNNNSEGMFVTVWLGILDIKTGVMLAANAGHENPLIYKDGKYEYLMDEHGLVLGAVEDMEYTDYEIKLNKGDAIFVYTDGVPDSFNIDEIAFGEEGLLKTINQLPPLASPEETIKYVEQTVYDYIGEASQYDDLTMLCLRYEGGRQVDTNNQWDLELIADPDKLDDVLDFVNGILEEHDCPMSTQITIDIALEEMFVNVGFYAYPNGNADKNGMVKIISEIYGNNEGISLTLIDSGIPYNPLDKPDPDITLSAQEREIGGLGIFMVKKSMDEVAYKYEDGKNIFTMKKKFG